MKIIDLNLVLSGHHLLSSMSFEIPKGSIFLILGPNGAGKTLLLRCLVGILKPTSGDIRERTQDLSWVPLSQNLPFSYTVRDIVLMGRFQVHQGFPGETDQNIVSDVLDKVQIRELEHRDYNSLSRGEQTKVDLARALSSGAESLYLDEPFANLDIDACLQIQDLLHRLRAEGKTIILSHHDLFTAKDLGSHGLLLRKGQLLRSGEISEIINSEAIEAAYGVRPVFGDEGRILKFERP